jgi:hypothetical protein
MSSCKDPVKELEHRKRLSESHKGKKQTPLTILKRVSHYKGKPRPQAVRDKISASHKGKSKSEEHKQHLRVSLKGRVIPPEVCKKMGDSRRGENNPAWRGGHSYEPYCPKFNKAFKTKVRLFFDNKCAICGRTTKHKLDVHHVDYNKQTCCDNSKPRFVALCRKCHVNTNHNREYWANYISYYCRIFIP